MKWWRVPPRSRPSDRMLSWTNPVCGFIGGLRRGRCDGHNRLWATCRWQYAWPKTVTSTVKSAQPQVHTTHVVNRTCSSLCNARAAAKQQGRSRASPRRSRSQPARLPALPVPPSYTALQGSPTYRRPGQLHKCRPSANAYAPDHSWHKAPPCWRGMQMEIGQHRRHSDHHPPHPPPSARADDDKCPCPSG